MKFAKRIKEKLNDRRIARMLPEGVSVEEFKDQLLALSVVHYLFTPSEVFRLQREKGLSQEEAEKACFQEIVVGGMSEWLKEKGCDVADPKSSGGDSSIEADPGRLSKEKYRPPAAARSLTRA